MFEHHSVLVKEKNYKGAADILVQLFSKEQPPAFVLERCIELLKPELKQSPLYSSKQSEESLRTNNEDLFHLSKWIDRNTLQVILMNCLQYCEQKLQFDVACCIQSIIVSLPSIQPEDLYQKWVKTADLTMKCENIYCYPTVSPINKYREYLVQYCTPQIIKPGVFKTGTNELLGNIIELSIHYYITSQHWALLYSMISSLMDGSIFGDSTSLLAIKHDSMETSDDIMFRTMYPP